MALLGVSTEVILAVLAGGLLLFVYFLYKHFYVHYQLLKSHGIKGPKPVPYFGNALDLAKLSGFNRGKHLTEQYGPVVGYYIGRLPIVMITDLDILKQIMVKEFDNFSDHFTLPNILLDGIDLFNSKGDKWRMTRRTLTPSFSASKLKMMLPLVKRSTDNLVAAIDQKSSSDSSFDANVVFSSYTMEVTLSTAFGRRVEFQKGETDDISKAVRLVVKQDKEDALMNFIVLHSNFPFIIRLLASQFLKTEQGRAGKYLAKVAFDLVKARRESSQKSKYKDILQLMIDASGEEEESDSDDEEKETKPPAECPAHKQTKTKGAVMTDDEIVANSFGFLFAGNETTASALSFASYLLALHPDIQEKLQSEIDDYFEDKPDSSLYTAAQELTYLDNVIQETLRLYPPALRTNRMCDKTTVINGVTIPKGASIRIPIYTLHHSPLLWAEPEKFDPDRFTPEEKAKRHQLSYMPFGFGPRSCIGMRLALLEAKVALIEVLKKYTFVRAPETEVPLQLTEVGLGLIRAKNGISLRVQKRS